MTKLVVFLLFINLLFSFPLAHSFELTPEDKAFLQNKKTLVVAVPSTGLRTHWNNSSSGESGVYTHYLKELAQALNVAMEFKNYSSLDKLLNAVASGEADLSLGFIATAEREKRLLFSVPVFANYQLNWLRNSSYRNTPANHMNWVCVKGSFSCEATANNGYRTLTKVKTLKSLIHHLSTGKADGAVMHFGSVHHYYQTAAAGDWLGDIVFNESSQPMLSSFITAKNNSRLMDILNQYQKQTQNNHVIKPFSFDNLSMLQNELAIEAIYQQYNRETIRYTIEDDLYPVSYIAEATGQISGYIHDIIKIFALKTGLNFEYVYPNGQSIETMLADKKVDFIPAPYQITKGELSNTLRTKPFYTINWSYIRTTKNYQHEKIAILDRSKKLSKQEVFGFLNKPIIYSDFSLLKNDIEQGVITHAYIPKSIADYYLYYGDSTSFELVDSQKKQLQTLMAIRLNQDSIALRDMFNVAIAITTPNEIQLAVQGHKRVHTEYVDGRKQAKSTIIILLLFFVVVVIAAVLWNTKLKGYLQEARAKSQKSDEKTQWLISVLNSFPGMVLISDAQGKPLLSNKAYNDCFKSCLDNNCIEKQTACSFLDVINSINQEVANNVVHVAINECIIGGKYFRVSRDVVNHNDGNQYHITVFADFTELKLRKNELKQSQQQAVEALKARESFLAIISHELRTPLAAMMGLMELLNPEIKTSKNKELMQNALASAERLKGLVNNILDFSKMEADQLQLDSYSSNLFEELGTSFRLHEASAKLKKIDFIIDWQPTQYCHAELDWLRLSQIINNLLGNSVKFTQSGTIKIRVSHNDNMLQIAIEDSGCGMTDEQLNTLFQPFTQADASINRKYGGTGLGMSIVQHLVQLMNGEISVLSEQYIGTQVFVNIPVTLTTIREPLVSEAYCKDETARQWLTAWGVNEQASQQITEITEVNVEGGNLYPDLLLKQVIKPEHQLDGQVLDPSQQYQGTILVADDDPINRFLFQKQLRKIGVKVITVNDGLEALLYLSSHRNEIDLLITDCHMPNLNGYELVRQLRAKPEFKSLTIVGCTAEDSRLVAEKAANVGMSEVIYKPYTFNALSELISRYCSKQEQDDNQERLNWLNDYSDEERLELSAIVRDSLLEDKALIANKAVPLPALGHRIKGAANALGLTQLAQAAAECENVDPHNIAAAIDKLNIEIDIVVNTINQWLSKQNQ
ncbi:ATP-binding protein [Shewanella fidelis]|uniref:histidine kinase n=1 Tax=Shewanella fidelis TaxID=173509 RepID=A0AAW8NSJ1_9GAMM|nr:transporter substrate-binding domain-containing protein [Shewanella fidelis]MDR8524643.1 ATP-binding protein [Shewanella fidelis]MDW4812118.1 ATP-binding protein [Shewanella fidelis]MDW4817427.1 ATP-binding protein [Shewanella fidelis]MDW4821494.1 ATP-binding protein [Shewanella fidelis]MDW4822725.1 ATP-binding protein [Shewanella fidelis]